MPTDLRGLTQMGLVGSAKLEGLVKGQDDRLVKYSLVVTDKSMVEKAHDASLLWRDYISGGDVKLSKLLSTLPLADVIDRDALSHKVNLVVARTWTVETVLSVLPVVGAMNGLDVNIDLSPYGVLQQELLDEQSPVYDSDNDYLLLLWQLEDFLPDMHLSWSWSDDELNGKIDDVVAHVLGLLKLADKNFNGRVLAFDFGLDALVSKGGMLNSVGRLSPDRMRQEINTRFRGLVFSEKLSSVSLLSLTKLQYKLGAGVWLDERSKLTARCPVSCRALISIFNEVVAFIVTSVKRPRKVLVLDGDNTLWGGVLGEDGVDGIQIGPEYPGNVFAAIQKKVQQFATQGVVIAVCSKNDQEKVSDLFASHPGMVLKEDDVAAWAVNWDPKSQNIKDLAVRLNLSMDSMVFIDDSPQERDEIKELCPDVLVPDVPSNPMSLYDFWMSFNPFDRISLSDEDKGRGQMYRDEEKRKVLKGEVSSLDDFYRGLLMRCRCRKAGKQDFQRVAQMSQRTNQFNATTVRMTDSDVRELCQDKDIYLLQISDKFGESGVAGCAVVGVENKSAVVEQFMMSCRVLKRKVENHFLGLLMREVLERADTMIVNYTPSERNGLFKEFADEITSDLECAENKPLHLVVNESNVDRLMQEWIEDEGAIDG